VFPAHRNRRLASLILAARLAAHDGPLWSTTNSEKVKHLLENAGFVRKGKEWEGGRGRLPLWLRGG
jgi:hypothetical protein